MENCESRRNAGTRTREIVSFSALPYTLQHSFGIGLCLLGEGAVEKAASTIPGINRSESAKEVERRLIAGITLLFIPMSGFF